MLIKHLVVYKTTTWANQIRFYITVVSVIFTMLHSSSQTKSMENFAIVIHGGAGTILRENLDERLEKLYKEKLTESVNAGYEILAQGGTALDAVTAAIKIMEDTPLFNAGKGAVFNHEGKIEMDASIMDGLTSKAGAVAGVQTIRNPIEGARAVMEKTEHVMLEGEGADRFAKEIGLKTEDETYFYDENRWQQFQKIRQQEKIRLDHDATDTTGYIHPKDVEFFHEKKFGTVGCVALDKYGNLAAGTSTGGMTNKKYGRVGDSPIIGAGTYANNKTCAVSCTGHGEFFIRNVVAYDVSARMEYKGLTLEQAATEVIMDKLKKAGGEGGLIAIDAKGHIVMSFNTTGMYRAYKKSGGKTDVKIFKD